ncbi:hypothetical protein G6F66_014893 [Rhizopus arrhizus]|nr:hypothetical protein G6F66_014893 [Rhizopus arrhizus]
MRAAVELTRDWRTDRGLRRLEAMLIVADTEHTLVLTGNGDVLEPEHGLAAIGSGGAYAQSAALANRWKSPAISASTPTRTTSSKRWATAARHAAHPLRRGRLPSPP